MILKKAVIRQQMLREKLMNEFNVTEINGKEIWECSLQELEDELWRRENQGSEDSQYWESG